MKCPSEQGVMIIGLDFEAAELKAGENERPFEELALGGVEGHMKGFYIGSGYGVNDIKLFV